MRFDPTEEQALVAKTAADFAARRLFPHAEKRDRDGTFPTAELGELGELGLLAINVPEELGGAGAGVVAYSLAMRELAAGDASVAVAVSVTNMVAELLARFGTPAQHDEHMARLIGGASDGYGCGAFALSEPEVGSDPAALATRATPDGDGYRLSGTKQWVTNGGEAGILIVWARTDSGGDKKHRGLTAFLVRGDADGLSVTRREEKMGLHGSVTAQLHFDNVRVEATDVLGDVGSGFKLAMIALDGGRIGIASQALGIAQMALEAALTYAKERVTFGQPIIRHQAVGNMLADAATWLEAAALMTLRAADRKERGLPFSREASMAKLLASEKAQAVCDIAIQVHGGYGYVRDFPVERAFRDVRVTRIYEGTSEIQRMVIARHLIKETSQ